MENLGRGDFLGLVSFASRFSDLSHPPSGISEQLQKRDFSSLLATSQNSTPNSMTTPNDIMKELENLQNTELVEGKNIIVKSDK